MSVTHDNDEEQRKIKQMYREKTHRNDSGKVDFLYKDKVDSEEYLLGKRVDAHFERQNIPQKNESAVGAKFDEDVAKHNDRVNTLIKQREDPLSAIRKKEEDARKALLNNPVKMKQLEKALKEQKAKRHSKDGDELFAQFLAIKGAKVSKPEKKKRKLPDDDKSLLFRYLELIGKAKRKRYYSDTSDEDDEKVYRPKLTKEKEQAYDDRHPRDHNSGDLSNRDRDRSYKNERPDNDPDRRSRNMDTNRGTRDDSRRNHRQTIPEDSRGSDRYDNNNYHESDRSSHRSRVPSSNLKDSNTSTHRDQGRRPDNRSEVQKRRSSMSPPTERKRKPSPSPVTKRKAHQRKSKSTERELSASPHSGAKLSRRNRSRSREHRESSSANKMRRARALGRRSRSRSDTDTKISNNKDKRLPGSSKNTNGDTRTSTKEREDNSKSRKEVSRRRKSRTASSSSGDEKKSKIDRRQKKSKKKVAESSSSSGGSSSDSGSSSRSGSDFEGSSSSDSGSDTNSNSNNPSNKKNKKKIIGPSSGSLKKPNRQASPNSESESTLEQLEREREELKQKLSKLPAYGLVHPKGESVLEAKANSDAKRKAISEKSSKHKARSPSPKRTSSSRKRSTERKTKEEKLQEMMDNAKWRDDQRVKNVTRYEEEQKQEDEAYAKNAGKNDDFIAPMMTKHAEESSIEDQLRRNRHKIQRTAAATEKNFARK